MAVYADVGTGFNQLLDLVVLTVLAGWLLESVVFGEPLRQ